ncbi:MAG: hypothetical protein HRT44_04255, partial [Bdellovibrionales bacterium]|nr:hypothetical protein [Bdellovibrionales bacterium]NQZ18456.1 hypothetical protein [Bdellovibrionales bacterium]
MRSLSLRLLLIIFMMSAMAVTAMASQSSDEAQWKKASQLIVANKITKAKRILLPLLRNSSLSKDLIYLTLGRLAFQQKKFSEALQHYSGVRQDSHYWL